MKSKELSLNTTNESMYTRKHYTSSQVSHPLGSNGSIKSNQMNNYSNKKLEIRKPKKKKGRKKIVVFLFIFFAFLGVLSAILFYFIYIPGKKVYDSANNIKETTYTLLSEVQSKDISGLEDALVKIKKDIFDINHEIDKFDFLGSWEQTKGYYDNFQQAQVILNKSDKLITEALPELKGILELSGFKTEKELVQESNTTIHTDTKDSTNSDTLPSNQDEAVKEEDGAITLILKNLSQYLNFYDDIEPKILGIFDELKKIDLDYLPSIGGFDLKDNVEKINSLGEEFPVLSDKVVNFIKEMPQLIGSNQDTTYLVILQNETEMRSSGGLLTSFGTVKVSNGQIEDEISLTDTWQLQYDMWRIGFAMPRNNIYGQSYLMNNGCGATEARAQDLGIYPDLTVTMKYFTEYYDRARRYFPDKYPSYDHVLILNYAFSENLLKLVQPLTIEGLGEATADNLYDFIKQETDNPEVFFDEDRKKVIKDLAKEAKKKFLNLGMSEIPKVLNLVVGSFSGKDIALYSKDKNIQQYFDDYGLSGRSENDFDGDYFQFSEAQNCSLKLNKFIRDTVDLDINIDDKGNISNKALIKWQQTKVFEDGLENQYSPSLSFSYRAWVRLILPVDTSNIVSNGYKKSGYLYYYPQDYYDETLNKEVSDNIVQFDHRRFKESDPVERKDMEISWSLPNTINYKNDGVYRLLIQKHPGKSWGEEYNINISESGSTNNVEIKLDRDKVVTYKNGIISVENYNTKLDWIIDLSNRVDWNGISSNE